MRPATLTSIGVASSTSASVSPWAATSAAARWPGLKSFGKATPLPCACALRSALSFSRRSAISWLSSTAGAGTGAAAGAGTEGVRWSDMGAGLGGAAKSAQPAILTADAGAATQGPLLRDAGPGQQVADQLEAHQRAVERHQALLELGLHRQQLAPAVGDPAAILETVRLADRQPHVSAAFHAAPLLEGVDQTAQGVGRVLQILGQGQGKVVGDGIDLGGPEAVLVQFARTQPEALRADTFDLHQAGLRGVEFADHGERADLGEGLGVGAGAANLLAVGQGDDTEGGAIAVAAADHVEVADL